MQGALDIIRTKQLTSIIGESGYDDIHIGYQSIEVRIVKSSMDANHICQLLRYFK